MDVSSVTIEPDTPNQMAMIIVDGPIGERTILWDRDERLMYREGELRKEEICSGKILHLDGHDIRAALRAACWAKEEKIPTVIGEIEKTITQTQYEQMVEQSKKYIIEGDIFQVVQSSVLDFNRLIHGSLGSRQKVNG